MIKVKEVFDFLNKKFPVETAMDFDNVGVLAGDENAETDTVVVALDCDKNTVRFAAENGAGLIVTHHPVIFDGVKSVLSDGVLALLVKNNISVISMHTNLDVGKGGVNDALCRALGLKSVKKFKADDGYILNTAKTDISDPEALAGHIKKSLGFSVRYVPGRPIKSVLVCSGSGGDFIDTAVKYGFDALITADVKQHHFITALNNNVSLFDGGHYSTENVVVKPICDMLRAKFKKTSFLEFSEDKFRFV